jgi:predicted Zn-dependent protease
MVMDLDRLKDIADKTVHFAVKQKANQAQASAFLVDSALTRFANSQIHQNVSSKSGGVAVKVVLDKRISTIRINSLGWRDIENAIAQAVKIAKASLPTKDFKSLPKPQRWTPLKGSYDKRTAEGDPAFRAERVKLAIETAHGKSPKVKAVAGYFSTEAVGFAVANSLGVSAWADMTEASMKVTVISRQGSSEGSSSTQRNSRRIKDIDPTALAENASEMSVHSLNAVKVEPGEYEVVLSPTAVSTLLLYAGFVGFSAVAYQDGQSFVKYSLNQQVFDEKMTVVDDAANPKTLHMIPIDGEGVPKKPLTLIEKGVVSEKSICYNSFYAGKEGKKTTGHARHAFAEYFGDSPTPSNMIMKSGNSSFEEALEDTRRGIFVNTVHYVNPVERTKMVLTGLTRDGTFLIEKGEISKPIVNMRFTDSLLSAFRNAPLIGKKLEVFGPATVPMVKMNKLKFVGVSAY